MLFIGLYELKWNYKSNQRHFFKKNRSAKNAIIPKEQLIRFKRAKSEIPKTNKQKKIVKIKRFSSNHFYLKPYQINKFPKKKKKK